MWRLIPGILVLLFLFFAPIINYINESYGIEGGTILKTIMVGFVVFEFYLLYRMRKRSSGEMTSPHIEKEEEKINFSEIPHSTEGEAPKPIDKSGNVFLHNEETLTEDMANIGIDRYNDSED